MTAMLSCSQQLVLVRSEGFHRWSAATIERVAVGVIAIAANESGCAEASRCNPKSDLAPRMPTFDQGVPLSGVLERENARDHRLDLPVIH